MAISLAIYPIDDACTVCLPVPVALIEKLPAESVLTPRFSVFRVMLA